MLDCVVFGRGMKRYKGMLDYGLTGMFGISAQIMAAERDGNDFEG